MGLADRFLSFVKSYAEHFISYRRDVSEKARQYTSGLMQAGSRKNIYAISEVVPDTDDRNLQQFITHSKWSAREVLDHVAHDASELIGDATDAALIIDESGFAQFHEDMRPFLVDLREHFTQIPTDVFLRLRSGYAMKMYMQVRSWNPSDIRNKYPSWKMDIEQVRWFFRLSPDQYEEPKHIAAAVLKRSMRELNERADVTFRYDSIKEGRKIAGWLFRAIPNTPTITLAAGAAAAKRRQERLDEEECTKATRTSTDRYEWVKERWR